MTGLTLVTGATGKTGRSLVARLEEAGLPHRAASRSGATPFDWMQPETWDAALEGVDAAYLVAPPTVPDPYSRLISFAQTAMRRGVRRFVFLSMASLPAGGPMHGQVHQWLVDHCDDWAVIGPSAFMQNFTEGAHLTTIREEDTFYSSTGGGRVPFISADDIAHAAFAALTAPAALNRDFMITGGEALSYDQVADRISEACGRTVTHTNITTDELVERFLARGLPPNTAWFLAAGYKTIADGLQERVADDFAALTGQTPTTFRAFASTNAEVWRRSPGST